MSKVEWYEKKVGKAEHLVYLNGKAKELEKLINREKSMIIRGAAGKKCPLGGRAKIGDIIYFVETGGSMEISYKAIISKVIESEKMTPDESTEFIKRYEKELNLSKDQYSRWNGKKYLAVYEISNLVKIEPFKYNRENNMDDWIITDDINKIKKIDFSKKEIFEILYNKDTTETYNKFLEIENSIEYSKAIYQYFDEIKDMLLNEKSSIRVRAFRIVCKLSKWDRENKVNKCIEILVNELNDDLPTAVRQCLNSLNTLLQYKPELFSTIEENLKKIDLLKYKDSMKPLIKKDIEKILNNT